MVRNRGRTPWVLGLCMVAAMLAATPAHAATDLGSFAFDFAQGSPNTSIDPGLFSGKVWYEAGHIFFDLYNGSPTGVVVTVLWEDAWTPFVDLSDASFFNPDPGTWTTGTSQGFPTLTPAFAVQQVANSAKPPPANGIQPNGDSAQFRFNLTSATGLADAWQAGNLRLGVHVISIDPKYVITSDSEFLVSTPVPLPAAAPLALFGMGLLGAVRVIRRKKN